MEEQQAFGRFPDALDGVTGEAFPLSEHGEHAATIADDAAAPRAGPERAGGILEEIQELRAAQRRRVALVERREADAVEAHESVVRRDPQIAVPRLQHGRDRVLREAVAR